MSSNGTPTLVTVHSNYGPHVIFDSEALFFFFFPMVGSVPRDVPAHELVVAQTEQEVQQCYDVVKTKNFELFKA